MTTSRIVHRGTIRISPFEIGYIVGLLVGEGSFTGDRLQPRIALNMHVRHERIFDWLVEKGGRKYGPYHHKDGRKSYRWHSEGVHLSTVMVPLLDEHLSPTLDEHSYGRYVRMKDKYNIWPAELAGED